MFEDWSPDTNTDYYLSLLGIFGFGCLSTVLDTLSMYYGARLTRSKKEAAEDARGILALRGTLSICQG